MTPFGTTSSGEEVHKVDLSAGDLTISVLTWGAVLQDVRLKDVRNSLNLGTDHLSSYEGPMRYYGSIIGPVVNRISAARVQIDGMMYELERNQDGRIHLHSGRQATHLRVWSIDAVNDTSVTLSVALMDGECGLPGNRVIRVTYRIVPPATLAIEFEATTDARTLMNLAFHGYWNLDGSQCWEGHSLQIAASDYLPTDQDAVPTGDRRAVMGTPMDFTQARELQAGEPPLDHNFCLSTKVQDIRDVAWLTGQNGVRMIMATDQPGLQVYDGRDSDPPYRAIALEAQCWPDAPANPRFPSITLDPGQTYRQNTQFTFDHVE